MAKRVKIPSSYDNRPGEYHFASGCNVEPDWRPSGCDNCKKQVPRVRQAPNNQGFRRLLCDECYESYREYMREGYWRGMSIQDACSDGALARMHLHNDDPPIRKTPLKRPPKVPRIEIKRLLHEREIERLIREIERLINVGAS